MKYRRLSNGDYSFGNNDQDFISGTIAVSQAIKTRLLLLQGEWWEQLDQGLPLFQHIIGRTGTPENMNSVDLLVQEVISNTPDVISIQEFKSVLENRTYSLSCKVSTKYGDAEVEVTF